MKIFKLTTLGQVSIVHLVSHIHMMVLPALMPLLARYTSMSLIDIGLAISVFNIVSAIAQAPMGFVVDRFGPSKVLRAGLFLGSVSFLSLSMLDHYYWLLAAMVLAGMANAVYHPADYAILSRCIAESRMGRAFSIHTFSGYVGTAITPILLFFVAQHFSIQSAFMLAGLIGLVSASLMWPMVKQLQPVLTQTPKPQSEPQVPAKPMRITSLFSPGIFLMLLIFLFISLSGNAMQNFSVTALVDWYQLPLLQANTALTLFLFASAFGVLAGGGLADRYVHHGWIAAGALLITALLAMILIWWHFTAGMVYLLMTLMGFLSGIIAPSRDMLVRAVSPKGAEGRVFGLVSTGFNFGGVFGPILLAWLLERGHPSAIFYCAALFMLITALLAFYQEWRLKQQRVAVTNLD